MKNYFNLTMELCVFMLMFPTGLLGNVNVVLDLQGVCVRYVLRASLKGRIENMLL